MKKVIELLEQMKAEIRMSSGKMAEAGLKPHGFISSINEVLEELKTPRWIPYKNLSDAHDCMSEAIKAVEKVAFRGRDEERRIKAALNRIECAMGAIETLIPLPLPRWETPNQWEKRTGKAWPDDWAVYALYENNDGQRQWFWGGYEKERDKAGRRGKNPIAIVCAAEAGPPPDDWRPEEDKTP
jgi:hypothetical protein